MVDTLHCPRCGRLVGCYAAGNSSRIDWHDDPALSGEYALCAESGEFVARSALHAFGEVIASCIRARLVARAMDGRDLRVSAGVADFAAWRFKDEWQVLRWIRGNGEDVTYVIGSREDTAAEVVDTLLRLAAEWSER